MGTARNKPFDALELLTSQHAEVDQLIARLEDEEMSADRKQFVFFELADKIAAHAAMEEQLFYPAVRAQQTEELLLESTEEHLSIKRVLADLLETDLDDARFDAKLKVLKEQLDHHAHAEEENELFPKLRRLMPAEQLVALGGEMLALFEQLITTQPRKQIRKETREPAEL